MKKKILIIGGSGFIGYLAKRCLAKGWSVSSFSSSRTKIRKLKFVNYIIGDISKVRQLNKINEHYDFVVISAGM